MERVIDGIEELRALVARFWELPEAEVVDVLRFDAASLKGFGSLRLFRFFAAVENRLGVRIEDPRSIRTFGELRAHVQDAADDAPLNTGMAAAASSVPVAHAPGPADAFGVGIALGHDIEEIASLPEATDYREDSFYVRNFSEAELDYCLTQREPRPHLAVRWCVKEAVRKCDARLLGVENRDIELLSTNGGAPAVNILDGAARRELRGARLVVSASHTETVASAVVMLLPAA